MNQRTETKALHAPSAMDASSNDRYPLSGVVVIDLSHIYNGPYATYLMALAGARRSSSSSRGAANTCAIAPGSAARSSSP